MLIRVLGSAAGGGFPQWNCSCVNCAGLRGGALRSKPRTQAQVAISANGADWYLLGASPDLRLQIESAPELLPGDKKRGSPVAGVVLLSAEIDQIAGLLSLRERSPFSIYATRSVKKLVAEENTIFRVLEREARQTIWRELKIGEKILLRSAAEKKSELTCRVFSAGTHFPYFAKAEARNDLTAEEAVLGVELEDEAGNRIFYAPELPAVTPELRRALAMCSIVMLDGTFWSESELAEAAGSSARAAEMGHLPLGGARGLLAQLADLTGPRKILIHINNTNPILNEQSAEHRKLLEAGWEVAHDGWSCDL